MRNTVISFFSVAAAAMVLLSCAKEARDNTLENPKGITVNAIADAAATKTAAVDGEIPTIKWLDSDKIKLFEIVDDQEKGSATSSNANIVDGKASFSTTLVWADPEGSSYHYSAVYPADNAITHEGSYYLLIDEDQYLNGNNFCDYSDVLISEQIDHGASRVADGENLMFSFRRIGTVVRLNLTGFAAGEKISKITLSAPAAIAGAVKYDPVTGTIDKENAFQAYASDVVTLHLDNYESGGAGDVIWFRVLAERAWAAGEAFSIEVLTDKGNYKKEVTLPSEMKFPDGGLTKFGVDMSSALVPPVAVPCLWDFEDGADGWNFFDVDGDGYPWMLANTTYAVPYSGMYALVSHSYSSGALTPDNWAFTPAVQLTEGNYLSFWVCTHSSWPAEHYAVYIAKGSPTGELSVLMPETEFPAGDYKEVGDNGYEHFVVQIPAEFDNQVVCIGFRHFNCTDQYFINLDDVAILEENPFPDPTAAYEDYLGEWAVDAQVITISQKEAGVSYSVSGLSGQGAYPVEARFTDHKLVLQEQMVFSEGNTDVALQGSDGYFPSYPDGSEPVIFSATYDEGDDILKFLPAAGLVYYMFITYQDQERTGYVYAGIPQSMTRYVPDSATYIYTEDFESDISGSWTFIDADQDGFNWARAEYRSYSPTHCLTSMSYDNDTYTALTPDNWAFTPMISLTSDNYVSFWIRAQDPNYGAEHYAVYIATEIPSDLDFSGCEVLLAEQEYPQGNPVDIASDGAYQRFVVPIPSSYDGKTVSIAFRHFNCYDQFMLNIDDVAVSEGNPVPASLPAPAPKFAPKFFSGAGNSLRPALKNGQRPVRPADPILQVKRR
jgi:hypothetical protein